MLRGAHHVQVRMLGEGAFATVEQALWNERPVAVKRLRREMYTDEKEVICFMQEGTAIAQLSHP